MAPSLLIVLCAVSATISLVSLARVLASRPGRPTGVWLDWAPGNRSYYVTSSRHSHLGCLTACADLSQEEGVPVAPACVDSAEASTFVADRTAGLTIFLGHHQWPNDRGASVGWRPATLDCNASYENWLPSEPDDLLEMQDCVAASFHTGGGWSDVGCERRLPCLCQKGAVLSESFAAEAWMHLSGRGASTRGRGLFGGCIYLLGCSVLTLALLCGWGALRMRDSYAAAKEDTRQGGIGRHREQQLRAQPRGGEGGAARHVALARQELSRAGAARRRIRVRVQMLLQVLGISSFFWAFTPLILSLVYRIWPIQALGSPVLPMALCPPAVCLAILSIRPSDSRMVLGMVAANTLLVAFASLLMAFAGWRTHLMDEGLSEICFAIAAIDSAVCLAFCSVLVDAVWWRRRQGSYSPRRALLLHCDVARYAGGLAGCATLAYLPLRAAGEDPASDEHLVPVLLGGLSLLSYPCFLEPQVRAAALSALCKTGSTAEEREAAVLAGLVAGRGGSVAGSVDTLLQWAESHFRTVSFDQLAKDDFVAEGDARASSKRRSSARRGSLLSPQGGSDGGGVCKAAKPHGGQWRSEPRAMGQCDAFISHSWSDPPGPKWAALSAWAEAFEEEHGRPPTVWLDKLCIDQRNVQEALACLPIFLAGCDRLLVLAGPTYSSRLWCVMELFAFLKMGAPLERITVLPFAEPSARQPDRAATDRPPDESTRATLSDVTASFASFDAEKARCARVEDRQALLSVIEESFGSFAEFNGWARRLIFSQVHGEGRESRVAMVEETGRTAHVEESIV